MRRLHRHGRKTLWSQAIYCRPPATFLFVELRCCCLAHDFGLNIAGDGDGCVRPTAASIRVEIRFPAPHAVSATYLHTGEYVPMAHFLRIHVHAKEGLLCEGERRA